MNVNRRKLWLVWRVMTAILLSASCYVGGHHVAQAQAGASVGIHPAETQLDVTETATLDVMVDPAGAGLYGAQFRLEFDPTSMQIIDAEAGTPGVQIELGPVLSTDLIETPGPDYVVALNLVDNTTGVVDFAVAKLNPAQPATDAGVLATVTFEGIADNVASISLSRVVLSDNFGQAIPASASGGTVTVRPLPTQTETDGDIDAVDAGVDDASSGSSFLPIDLPGTSIAGIILGLMLIGGAIIGGRVLKRKGVRHKRKRKKKTSRKKSRKTATNATDTA